MCTITIYTVSDVGDSRNLIGVFPVFVEKDLSKVDKIPGLMFLKARKDSQLFKTAFSRLLKLVFFLLDGMFTTTVQSIRKGPFCKLTVS